MGLDRLTDEQLHVVIDPDNRAVVDLLDEAGRPLEGDELAERLLADVAPMLTSEEYETRLEETRRNLHQERLPKLDAVGLVEYDPESNVAAVRSGTPTDADRRETAELDELLAHLQADPGDAGGEVGTLEGRQAVIEYGCKLAADAEEELFCMFVNTDLLDDDCVRHARDAIDRGVTIHLGSKNPDVHDLAQTRLPEVNIWTPHLDWLNTVSYPRVGRLVLRDRRAVMLGVLEESPFGTDGSDPAETAIVADGRDHPLVVLVRELLGSRLDHLDFQSQQYHQELSL